MVLWFPLWREENSRGNHIERAIQIFCWIQFLRKSFQRKCNLRVKWTISQSPSWKVVQLVGIWQRERLKFGKAFFCILNAGMHLECSVQITGNTVNKSEGKLWPSYDQVLKPNLEKRNLYVSERTKHSNFTRKICQSRLEKQWNAPLKGDFCSSSKQSDPTRLDFFCLCVCENLSGGESRSYLAKISDETWREYTRVSQRESIWIDRGNWLLYPLR